LLLPQPRALRPRPLWLSPHLTLFHPHIVSELFPRVVLPAERTFLLSLCSALPLLWLTGLFPLSGLCHSFSSTPSPFLFPPPFFPCPLHSSVLCYQSMRLKPLVQFLFPHSGFLLCGLSLTLPSSVQPSSASPHYLCLSRFSQFCGEARSAPV